MIDLSTIDDAQLNGTIRLIRDEITRRGWQGSVPYAGSSHVLIDRRDGGAPVRIFGSTPVTTSYVAGITANDKHLTYLALIGAGIPQLETVVVTSDLGDAYDLMDRYEKVVVKPVDGGHGNGITVGVSTKSGLEKAVQYALLSSGSSKRILVQAQFDRVPARDIRVTCIDFTYVAALMRVPARVYGDGVSTIRQLIERENESPQRGERYRAPLARIDAERAAEYLGEIIDSIPIKGEEVWVLGVANYGAGGELVDVTDVLPAWMRQQAERASRVAELPVAGVDFMMSDKPHLNLAYSEQNAVIIEINKCPSLVMHNEPTHGTPRDVVALYADYLATI